jgi:tetratricopeptide (TPR) repeat protein
MPELSDEIHVQVEHLCAEGDELGERGEFNEALSRYWEAWELLPEPRTEWSAALWILAAIGDTNFLSGNYVAGRDALMTAMKIGGDATGNPFLRLRLGQCLFELGELPEAANWLAGAYLLEGTALFSDEDPKYLDFVKPQLRPPPEGWPQGW